MPILRRKGNNMATELERKEAALGWFHGELRSIKQEMHDKYEGVTALAFLIMNAASLLGGLMLYLHFNKDELVDSTFITNQEKFH